MSAEAPLLKKDSFKSTSKEVRLLKEMVEAPLLKQAEFDSKSAEAPLFFDMSEAPPRDKTEADLSKLEADLSKFHFKDVCYADHKYLIPAFITCFLGLSMGVIATVKDRNDSYVYIIFHSGFAALMCNFLFLFLGIYSLQGTQDIHKLFRQKRQAVLVTGGRRHTGRMYSVMSSKWKDSSLKHWWIGSLLTLAIPPVLIGISFQVNDGLDPILSKNRGPAWHTLAYVGSFVIFIVSATPIWIIATYSLSCIHDIIYYIEYLIEDEQWELALDECIRTQDVINQNFEIHKCIASLGMVWLQLGILTPILLWIMGLAVLVTDHIIDPEHQDHGSRAFVWTVIGFGGFLAVISLYAVSLISSRFDDLGRRSWSAFHKDRELGEAPRETTHQDMELVCQLQWHQKVVSFLSQRPCGIYVFDVRLDFKLLMAVSRLLFGYFPIIYGAVEVLFATKREIKFMNRFNETGH